MLAAALALYANISAFPPSFEPVYSIYGDNSNFYWIQSFLDPRLFAHDAWTTLFKSRATPFTVDRVWIWLTSVFMRTDPYTIGLKALSVILLTSSALMVRRLARVSGAGVISAQAAALFAVLFLSMDTFYGTNRAYGVVILLGFITALQQKRFLLLAPLIMTAFVFYPAVSVSLGAAALAAPLFYRKDFNKGYFALYTATLGLAAIFILAARVNSIVLSNLAANLGSGQLEAYKLTQFVPVPLDPGSPLVIFLHFVLNFNEHGRFYPVLFTLLTAIAAAGFFKRPGRPEFLPEAFKPVLAGSAAAFAVLYPIHLVSASRQFVFIVPLLLVFLAAEGLERLTGAKYRFMSLPAVIILFVCLNPFLTEVINCRRYLPAYNYFSATEHDAVVAAYPAGMLAATIPVFSKRESFVSYQQDDLQILSHGAEGFEARCTDLLDALYSGEKQMKRFSDRYGVDYLVLEKEYYDKDFLEGVRPSPMPNSLRLVKVLNKNAGNPADIYRKAGEIAEFSWISDGKEGLIIDMRKLNKNRPGGQ